MLNVFILKIKHSHVTLYKIFSLAQASLRYFVFRLFRVSLRLLLYMAVNHRFSGYTWVWITMNEEFSSIRHYQKQDTLDSGKIWILISNVQDLLKKGNQMAKRNRIDRNRQMAMNAYLDGMETTQKQIDVFESKMVALLIICNMIRAILAYLMVSWYRDGIFSSIDLSVESNLQTLLKLDGFYRAIQHLILY